MPSEEKKTLISDPKEIEMTYNSLSSDSSVSMPISLTEQKIKDCIRILENIQSKRAKLRKRQYGVALGAAILGVTALGLTISTYTNNKTNATNDFNFNKIPNTNSTCANEYSIDVCNRNDNSTAAICYGLQQQYCTVSPLVIAGVVFMGVAFIGALLEALKAYSTPEDPTFYALALKAKEEDKAAYRQVNEIAREFDIKVTQSLSQLIADFKAQAIPFPEPTYDQRYE